MNRALLAILALVYGGSATAQPGGPYTFDFPKAYPVAASAWKAQLPDQLRATAWLADFKGVSAPVVPVVVDGKAMLYAWACRAHDCDRNSVNFLMSADQRRIVGVARLTTELPKTGPVRPRHTSLLFVGDISNTEARCLMRFDALTGAWKEADKTCP